MYDGRRIDLLGRGGVGWIRYMYSTYYNEISRIAAEEKNYHLSSWRAYIHARILTKQTVFLLNWILLQSTSFLLIETFQRCYFSHYQNITGGGGKDYHITLGISTRTRCFPVLKFRRYCFKRGDTTVTERILIS